MPPLIVLSLVLAATPPQAPLEPPRFAVHTLEVSAPAAASADARYVVQASARLQDSKPGASRFQLKTALVDCTNSPVELVFGDGFE